jgi:hypothetical protein
VRTTALYIDQVTNNQPLKEDDVPWSHYSSRDHNLTYKVHSFILEESRRLTPVEINPHLCNITIYVPTFSAIPSPPWAGPWGSRRFRITEFLDNRHMKVVMLLALRTGRLHSQEVFKSIPYHSIPHFQFQSFVLPFSKFLSASVNSLTPRVLLF